jgi:hypothetical protein
MKPVFRAGLPADAAGIEAFLREVFHAEAGGALAPELLQWKYWADRGDGQQSRSFLLEGEAGILAHGATWPSTVLTSYGRPLDGAQVIDWAAADGAPGAGLAIMKNVSKLIDLIFALGGSETTRRILPIFGFRAQNEIGFFAKPLRPVRQILSHQHRNRRLAARLFRNAWWSMTPALRLGPGWSSREVSGEEIQVWPEPRDGVAVMRRDAAAFRYFSGAAGVRTTLQLAEFRGKQAGYFYLVFAPGQARIADAWAAEADPEMWKGVYTLAIRRAMQERGINEIVSIAGTEPARQALAGCGFRLRRTDPLMVYDSRKQLQASDHLHFQLVDNDAYFRHGGRPEYET